MLGFLTKLKKNGAALTDPLRLFVRFSSRTSSGALLLTPSCGIVVFPNVFYRFFRKSSFYLTPRGKPPCRRPPPRKKSWWPQMLIKNKALRIKLHHSHTKWSFLKKEAFEPVLLPLKTDVLRGRGAKKLKWPDMRWPRGGRRFSR